ncbi:MAG: hypothetical protein ACRDCW_15695 [Sarcina sp.]
MVANNAFMIQEMKEKELQKGHEQGIEQGEKLKAIEIAKNLLDVLEDEVIATKTGLSIEEVKRLRKEN